MGKKINIVLISFMLLVAAAIMIFYGIRSELPKTAVDDKAVMAKEEGLLFDRAKKAAESGDLNTARDVYQRIVEKFPSSNKIAKAQEALDEINIKILFSGMSTKDSVVYEVQKGDTITRIAKKFGTTPELIMKSNDLKDPTIQVGRKLKVNTAKFSIVVDKSQNILTLKSGQDIVKTYRVSTGKNSCTPVGTFKITNKIVDPLWYKGPGMVIPAGDHKNVLGSRWLGISKPSYGIHGTVQPDSIGESVTEGCVRMKNSDVEELYVIVPEGTEVVITD